MLSEENEPLSSCDIVHVAGVVQGIVVCISSAAAGSRQQIRAESGRLSQRFRPATPANSKRRGGGGRKGCNACACPSPVDARETNSKHSNIAIIDYRSLMQRWQHTTSRSHVHGDHRHV
jgi:hypothetical protein